MGWSAFSKPVAGPNAGASKHARSLYDAVRRRVVICGGDRDGSDAGNPEVWSFVTGTSTSTLLKDKAGAGLRPAYPDNCTWDYDTRRDRYVIMRGFWFGLARAQQLHPAKPANEWEVNGCCFNPTTNVWENPLPIPGHYPVTVEPYPANQFPQFGFGGDSNCNFGLYDPVSDSMLRFFWDGAWGNSLQIIPLADTGVTPPVQIVHSLGAGHPSGGFLRNYMRNVDAHSRQPALDVQGRAL